MSSRLLPKSTYNRLIHKRHFINQLQSFLRLPTKRTEPLIVNSRHFAHTTHYYIICVLLYWQVGPHLYVIYIDIILDWLSFRLTLEQNSLDLTRSYYLPFPSSHLVTSILYICSGSLDSVIPNKVWYSWPRLIITGLLIPLMLLIDFITLWILFTNSFLFGLYVDITLC